MQLTINGQSETVPEGLSVAQLIEHLAIDGPVAVERNRAIVPRAQHGSQKLNDGDSLEIVHFVGGG